MREVRHQASLKDQRVGFVPTMGALHEGHLSLVRQARKENDLVYVSIFVNPTQFGEGEDFDRYPKPLERDLELLRKEKVDVVFTPSTLYGPGHGTYVTVEGSPSVEGSSRPDHFKGVATVVSKLFNIIQPTNAYFGQKDGIQCITIKRMVREMDFPLTVRIVPTLRESDGLAMSSRNTFLGPQGSPEREAAVILNEALLAGRWAFKDAEEQGKTITAGGMKKIVELVVAMEPLAELLYVSAACMDTGAELPEDGVCRKETTMISIAARVGQTRLIDNFIVGDEGW
jgi:pantoate--beta-alanine ligase